MKFLLCACFCAFICSCSSPHKNATAAEVKSILDTIPEPFAAMIPDSLKEWIPIFDEIGITDQKYRSLTNPSLLKNNRKSQQELDSLNFILVDSFLRKNGYPSMYQVGVKGMRAVRLVMQHGNRDRQIFYYSMIKEAFATGKIGSETFILFEDRLNIFLHRRQYYGSQIVSAKKTYFAYPVVNYDSIESYRNQIGSIQTFEHYVTQFYNNAINKNSYLDNETWLMEKYKVSDSASVRFIPEKLTSLH